MESSQSLGGNTAQQNPVIPPINGPEARPLRRINIYGDAYAMWHEGATMPEEEKQEFIHIAMAKFAGAVGQGEERSEPTIVEDLGQERTDELYTRDFGYSTEVNVLSQQHYEENADPETGVVEAMRIQDDNSTYSIMYSMRDGKFGVYTKLRGQDEVREAQDKEIGRIGYLAEVCTQRSHRAPEEY